MIRWKKFVLVTVIIGMGIILSSCGFFGPDIHNLLAGKEIPERIEPEYEKSYFSAIMRENSSDLKNALYEEEEIHVVYDCNDFYGRSYNDDRNIDRESYVESYNKYFEDQDFAIKKIDLFSDEDRRPSYEMIGENEYQYEAFVRKEFFNVPDHLNTDYVMEYELVINLILEDGVYYITGISKSN